MNHAELWKDYRRCTGRLTWRLAVPEDLEAMKKIKMVTERFLDQRQKNPPLLSKPTLLTLVAENEKGKIVDVLYVEAQVEICKVGCTKVGFEESAALEDDIHRWLKAVGFTRATINTNHELKEHMAVQLEKAGFSCANERFSHWWMDL